MPEYELYPGRPFKKELFCAPTRHFFRAQNASLVSLFCEYRRTPYKGTYAISPGHYKHEQIRYFLKISGFSFSYGILFLHGPISFCNLDLFNQFICRCMRPCMRESSIFHSFQVRGSYQLIGKFDDTVSVTHFIP